MSKLWTEDIGLFEDVLHVISDIGRSRSTFNRELLKNKLDELRRLGRRDSSYLIPSYYIAMIKDVLGNFKQTETDLHNLINALPDRSFKEEIIPTRLKTNPIE
jgi:hypothetical protein